MQPETYHDRLVVYLQDGAYTARWIGPDVRDSRSDLPQKLRGDDGWLVAVLPRIRRVRATLLAAAREGRGGNKA
jgi:hypothetical protein